LIPSASLADNKKDDDNNANINTNTNNNDVEHVSMTTSKTNAPLKRLIGELKEELECDFEAYERKKKKLRLLEEAYEL